MDRQQEQVYWSIVRTDKTAFRLPEMHEPHTLSRMMESRHVRLEQADRLRAALRPNGRPAMTGRQARRLDARCAEIKRELAQLEAHEIACEGKWQSPFFGKPPAHRAPAPSPTTLNWDDEA